MILVIPMAGRGQRFKDQGFTVPKPFIDVRGEWMVTWALKSFDPSRIRKIVFLVLKEHNDEFDAVKKLKEKYGEKCECVIVDHVTEGAACTVLLAKEFINTDEDIIAKDSDGYIKSHIHDTVEKYYETDILGILPTIVIPEGDRYCFARVGTDGYVAEVAERKRISNNVITGMYYFRHGSDFVKYAEQMITKDKRINNEFYIAPVYQEMIEDGKKLVIDQVQELWDLGTPEMLQKFLGGFKE